jgi:flagellar protein FliO/FliZ
VSEFYAATVALGQVNAAMTVGSTIYGILYFIFMSAVILVAAYYVTKFVATKGLNTASNKNLKVIETVHLGVDKSLLLVKVGEQYLLLGSTQKTINLLTEVNKEKLTINSMNEVSSSMESDSIEAYMGKLQDENDNVNTIKHSLNRLKSIVRGNKTDV